MNNELLIGVLALQGDVEENIKVTTDALRDINLKGKVISVRYPEEILKVDGLIIPGGAQFYNGDSDAAIKAFAITLIAWIGYYGAVCLLSFVTAGIASVLFILPLPWVLQLWYAYQGYLDAQKIQAGTSMNFYPVEGSTLTIK